MTKRALRLHEKYTKDQLLDMQSDVMKDPRYRNTDECSTWLLNKEGRRLVDELGWAIYWHGAPRGNTRTVKEPLQVKNW